MAEQPSAQSRVFWPFPGIVFALLGLSLTMATVTTVLATNDPSFGLEEDYFAKAVAWDETAAQLERNKQLGWQAEAILSGELDGRGERSVTVLLTDAQGAALASAQVEVFAFHHARRKQTLGFELVEVSPGRYAGGAPMARQGQWTLRLSVTRGDDLFTSAETGWAR